MINFLDVTPWLYSVDCDFQEYGAMMKTGCNDVVKGSVTLYPAMSLYVNIELEARWEFLFVKLVV